MKEHRITARSRSIGQPWYDKKGKEWREFTCGVTGHSCNITIKIKTGNRK